jgi:hypothetical protein
MTSLTMLKTAHLAFALTLLLPLAHGTSASAAPHASFSHGFSSHASPAHGSSAHVAPAAPGSGFGSFGSRPAGASAPAGTPSRGFGAFGNAAATPRQSGSALSQQLDKNATQARALQTLDQRRAAQQAQNTSQNIPQPVPGHAQPAPGYAPPAPAPAAPATVIVHQGSGGLGHVLAGALIANSVNAHARAGYYPPPLPSPAGAGSPVQTGGSGFISLFLWLCLLSLVGWAAWFGWKRVGRRAANREAAKPNYSFERK